MKLKSILEKVAGGKVESIDVNLTEEEKKGQTLQNFILVKMLVILLIGIGIGAGLTVQFADILSNILFREVLFTDVDFLVSIALLVLTYLLWRWLIKKIERKFDRWREKNNLKSLKDKLLTDESRKKIKLHRGTRLGRMKWSLYFMIPLIAIILYEAIAMIVPFHSSNLGIFETYFIIIIGIGTLLYTIIDIRKMHKERREAIEKIKDNNQQGER